MSLVEQGYKWVYCYLCEGLELVCPKCKKSSCCGGGCDFCHETFEEFMHSPREGTSRKSKFIQDHVLEIPDSIPVIGMGMERAIEENRKAENG